MNITRENIDDLNAVVKIDIAKDDYQPKVEKILKDYRKTANIPGFRKGRVPMGMVKKQYGKAVLVDEVNKLLQESLNKYLTEEKLDVLGNPIPKEQEGFNWENEEYTFEFELGLSPDFEVNLDTKEPIVQYKIIADEKMIEEQVKSLQKQHGKLISIDKLSDKEDIVAGTFKNEEEGIENKTSFPLEKLTEKNQKEFIGKKAGDVLSLNTKELFENSHDMMEHLKVDHDKIHDLDIDVEFEITETNKQELAELNQEFFDKIVGEGEVKSLEEFKTKIKEDSEKQFVQHSDQKLLNDVTETLIENTEFELPEEFLQKWIKTVAENPMDSEEAKEEYERSEKGLRFQLIEGKIINENDLQVEFDEIKKVMQDRIRMQMAQFGQTDLPDKQIDDITARLLSNEEEVKKLSEEIKNQKLLKFFKENANLKEKEISFEDFVKEAYQ